MNLDDASAAEREILYNMLFKKSEAGKTQKHLFEHLKPDPYEATGFVSNSNEVAFGPLPNSDGDPSQQNFEQGNNRHHQGHAFGESPVTALSHDQNGPHGPSSQSGKILA